MWQTALPGRRPPSLPLAAPRGRAALTATQAPATAPSLTPVSFTSLTSVAARTCAGFREVRPADFPAITALLNGYLERYGLCQRFSEAELRHFLLPQPDLMYAYVVEDAASGAITDLVSFYCLPSSVLNNAHHSELKAAYMCARCARSGPRLLLASAHRRAA